MCQLARKRYQHGSLFLRGTRRKQWIGRWLEDIIIGGVTKRVHKSEVLGHY